MRVYKWMQLITVAQVVHGFVGGGQPIISRMRPASGCISTARMSAKHGQLTAKFSKINADDEGWEEKAASSLHRDGFCILTRASGIIHLRLYVLAIMPFH